MAEAQRDPAEDSGVEPGAAEPSVEELIEQIRELDVRQFLLTTLSTLASLTYAKLDAKDLEQAHVGIEALSALVSSLESEVEPQTTSDLRSVLANLQLAFANAAAAG